METGLLGLEITHSRRWTLWQSAAEVEMRGDEGKGTTRRNGVRGRPLELCVTAGYLLSRTQR